MISSFVTAVDFNAIQSTLRDDTWNYLWNLQVYIRYLKTVKLSVDNIKSKDENFLVLFFQLLSEHQQAVSLPSHKKPLKFYLPTFAPRDHPQGRGVIDRFHSKAVFDNVTLNCCIHCKGDINVVWIMWTI